jgi:hypothetical protein
MIILNSGNKNEQKKLKKMEAAAHRQNIEKINK